MHTTLLADVSLGVADHTIAVHATPVRIEPSTTDHPASYITLFIPLGGGVVHTAVMDVEAAALTAAVDDLRAQGVVR